MQTLFLLTPETTLRSSRGAAGLCSSTLEKLKGFTCSAEPSDTASSKICDEGSIEGSHKNSLQQTAEEHEDEEEEVKEKESFRLDATKQVPNLNVDSITSLSSVFWQQVGPRMKV